LDTGASNVHVYNFGRCSYISGQERALLEQLIISGNVPNLAIFIDGLNDFAHFQGVPGFTKELTQFMNEGDKPAWQKIIREFPVTKFFLKFRDSISEKKDMAPSQIVLRVISRYKTNKDIVEAICDKFHIKTIFVWQPAPIYKYDANYNIFNKFDYDHFVPYLKLGYETMAKEYVTGEFGDNFIWLADIQQNLKESLYVDAFHYSAAMNKLIAEQISMVLSQKGILP
ncbi:MAG: hypothetical protein ACP5VS_16740, partial [Desulfomonilaceae bacterium]